MVVRACSPSYSGGWGGRIAWNRKTEVAVSLDAATALQPGETLSQKKKNKRERVAEWLLEAEEGREKAEEGEVG